MNVLRTISLSVLLSFSGFAQPGSNNTADLSKEIAALRKKTIPEAYFWLSSRYLPGAITFAPDARGGAFVFVVREIPLSPETSVAQMREAVRRIQESSRAVDAAKPSLDEKRRKVVYYSPSAWQRLMASVKPYIVSNDKVARFIFVSQPKEATTILSLEIPPGRENEFVHDLIERGLGVPISTFQGNVGWN
jgi:hypothetical protein